MKEEVVTDTGNNLFLIYIYPVLFFYDTCTRPLGCDFLLLFQIFYQSV